MIGGDGGGDGDSGDGVDKGDCVYVCQWFSVCTSRLLWSLNSTFTGIACYCYDNSNKIILIQ